MPRTNDVRDRGDWGAPSDGPCADCGVDVSQAPAGELGPSILALLPRWTAILMRPGVACATGPLTRPVLEHAVHVRDFLRTSATRLGGLLCPDDPLLRDWEDRSAPTAGGLDPVQVAVELEDAGRAVAARLGALAPKYVAKHGVGSAEAPAAAVDLGRRLVHDVVHHLHGVNAWQTPDE